MSETATRGTTNGNVRGNAEDRRRRREYLVTTYRADADVPSFTDTDWSRRIGVPLGFGEPACRCYRCGILLSVETVTADRIIPGALGGTYRRNNIRPACGSCNSITGATIRRRA